MKRKDRIKAMDQGELSNSVTHAECAENERTPDTWKELKNMDDWTKEHVYQWLIDVKVQEKYANVLYNEDVTGASLILFEKQDFLDAGLKHGPAVLILKNVALFKTSTENKYIAKPEDTSVSVEATAEDHFEQEKAAAKGFTTESAELGNWSVEEKAKSSVQTWTTEDNRKCEGKTSNDTSHLGVQDIIDQEQDVTCFCEPRPFDIRTKPFEYIQNQILPPETGPSNLIDPIHEFKLLVNTDNVPDEDILRKFTNKTFRFAAACMNRRTNGTIHFGVGDEPLHKHGQIIGLELTSPNKYVNAFDTGLKKHFKEKANIAMACIRPPMFVRVKCPDNSVKWVVEIDVVPKYELTKNYFFITMLDKKDMKSKCYFVRDGANTINYLPEKNSKTCKKNSKTLKHDLELWVMSRKLAEENVAQQRLIQLLESQSLVERTVAPTIFNTLT